MNIYPSCQRQFKQCKVKAEGQIGAALVCYNCLEMGEHKEFKRFGTDEKL